MHDKKKKRRTSLRYFYLSDVLYKKVRIDRAADSIVAWCYDEATFKKFVYSDVLRRYKKAYSMADVSELLDRSREIIYRWERAGLIPSPQRVHQIPKTSGKVVASFWTEEQVLEIHDMVIEGSDPSIHFYERMRPARGNFPSRRELLAMMHDNEVLYVKEGDEFVPSFRAQDIF